MCCNGRQTHRTEFLEQPDRPFGIRIDKTVYSSRGMEGLYIHGEQPQDADQMQSLLLSGMNFSSSLTAQVSQQQARISQLKATLEQKQKSLLIKAIEIELKKHAIISELERYEDTVLRAKRKAPEQSADYTQAPSLLIQTDSFPIHAYNAAARDSSDSENSYYGQGYGMLSQPGMR